MESVAAPTPASPSTSTILDMPKELLDQILEKYVPDVARHISIDNRSSLSVESVTSTPPPLEGSGNQRLDIWSKVCPKFEDAGLRLKYLSINIRCSQEGFAELRNIYSQPKLAAYVRKFSYMVYGMSSISRERFRELLEAEIAKLDELKAEISRREQTPSNRARGNYFRLTNHQLVTKSRQSLSKQDAIRKMMERSEEQRRIRENGIDKQEIMAALRAFERLEQIRLMRVHDTVEMNWENYSRTVTELAPHETTHARWAIACDHAATTLAQAFSETDRRPPRISGRALPPQTLRLLLSEGGFQTTLPGFARRLDSLELQFIDRANLDQEIEDLSTFFKPAFTAATNVRGLHIGFTRPVSTPFESMFHDIHWESLLYVGFGAWKLTSEDIIRFVLRHRSSLKAIRLRGVLLKEGSLWTDILRVLRLKVNLKWVSLRDVGYDVNERQIRVFDDNDLYDTDSESEIETESEGESESSSNSDSSSALSERTSFVAENNPQGEEDQPVVDEEVENVPGTSSYTGEASGDESDMIASEPESPTINSFIEDDQMVDHITTLPNSRRWCKCRDFAWESLREDDGNDPPKELWLYWEYWVVNRCSEHDEAASQEWQQSTELIAGLES